MRNSFVIILKLIHRSEIMTEFFRECVKKIMDLLEMHMFQIDNMGKRTKVSIDMTAPCRYQQKVNASI